MKRLLPLLLVGGLVTGCATDAAPSPNQANNYQIYHMDPAPGDPPPGIAAAPAGDVQAQIDAVKQATTPAQAMDAYSHGMAINRTSAALEDAYIHKMVDFDLPQDAAGAARTLLTTAPDNALARSVVAVDEARHGDLPDALQDIVLAAQKLPDDPFVQKQAGQILAWYDNTPRKPPVARSIQAQMVAVRQTLESKPAYADAYKQAVDFYKQAQAIAATQPTLTQAGSGAYPAEEQPEDGGVYAQAPIYQPPEAELYGAVPAEPYYYPIYPYDYDYWGWSPFFCGADVVFFDHFYCGDFHRDHGWNFAGGRHFSGAAGARSIGSRTSGRSLGISSRSRSYGSSHYTGSSAGRYGRSTSSYMGSYTGHAGNFGRSSMGRSAGGSFGGGGGGGHGGGGGGHR